MMHRDGCGLAVLAWMQAGFKPHGGVQQGGWVCDLRMVLWGTAGRKPATHIVGV